MKPDPKPYAVYSTTNIHVFQLKQTFEHMHEEACGMIMKVHRQTSRLTSVLDWMVRGDVRICVLFKLYNESVLYTYKP